MSAWIWLLIALVLAVVEVTNLAIFAVFAAVGALAGALASALGADAAVQIALFAGVSVGGVALVRRPIVRALGRGRVLRSGVAGLVGQHGTVVAEVSGTTAPGSVHVRGEDWPAVTYDHAVLEVGQPVEVLDVDSTRLVVTAA